MILVGRHIEGITLNDLEYLMDASGELMEFDREDGAIKFLKDKGFTDEDIYNLVFVESEVENG